MRMAASVDKKSRNPFRVLVLCTGNSCRSQMAEGWLRHELGELVEVASAGTHPAGYVHPLAIRVMAEAGVDISNQYSKHVNELASKDWDLVVTVCDSAREECPIFPGARQTIHVGFPDPVLVGGSEQARLAAFRQVRDAIRAQLVSQVASKLRQKAGQLG
ncbi:MAG: arsenate reductase ArsC [Thermoanaerobaculaceae bacterium]